MAPTSDPACDDTSTPANAPEGSNSTPLRERVFGALRNWETPPAYRGRLRVALVLVVVASLARYLNGGKRLPLDKLFNNVLYSSTSNTQDSFGYTIVYGPNFGVLILSVLVRFMLRRPQQQQEHHE